MVPSFHQLIVFLAVMVDIIIGFSFYCSLLVVLAGLVSRAAKLLFGTVQRSPSSRGLFSCSCFGCLGSREVGFDSGEMESHSLARTPPYL